jgi:hypothetical protein
MNFIARGVEAKSGRRVRVTVVGQPSAEAKARAIEPRLRADTITCEESVGFNILGLGISHPSDRDSSRLGRLPVMPRAQSRQLLPREWQASRAALVAGG